MNGAKRLFPVIFVAAIGSAGADGVAEEPTGRSFDELDLNGDGMITRDEATATPGLGESFDQLDADADGILSRDEIGVGGPATEEAPESGPASSGAEPDPES